MKKIALFISILFIVSSAAYARIGETLQQCIERYGQPIKTTPEGMILFSKSGLYVFVHFFEEKADAIAFRKVEEDALQTPAEISQNEIDLLLSSNGQGHEWKKREVISMDSEWETDDGKIIATYGTMQHLLIVVTKDYTDREDAAKKAKEKENLNNF